MTPSAKTTTSTPPPPSQVAVTSLKSQGHSPHLAVIGNPLLVIQQLNDTAIDRWERVNDTVEAEVCFRKALHNLHEFCSINLIRPDQLSHETMRRRSKSSTETLFKRVMGGDTHASPCFGVTLYNRAFVFRAGSSQTEWNLDSIILIAAALFYNSALFYHMRSRASVHVEESILQSWLAHQYYTKANEFLENYIDSTREPIWLLQASIYYNFAVLCRDQSIMMQDERRMSGFRLFVDQLSIIANWVPDQEARRFFSLSTEMVHMLPC